MSSAGRSWRSVPNSHRLPYISLYHSLVCAKCEDLNNSSHRATVCLDVLTSNTAAIVAQDQLLVVVTLMLVVLCIEGALKILLVAAFEAHEICTQGDAFFPHFFEIVRSGAQVWMSGWRECCHGLESVLVVGIATDTTRQAHAEGPFGFLHLSSVFCALLFCCIPLSHRLLPRHCATQDLQ